VAVTLTIPVLASKLINGGVGAKSNVSTSVASGFKPMFAVADAPTCTFNSLPDGVVATCN